MERDDHILYPVDRLGGGVDGRDPSDKGGICAYTTTEKDAKELVGKLWGGGSVKPPIVVDYNAEVNGIKLMLSPLQRFVLKEKFGIDLTSKPPMRSAKAV